MNVPIDSSPSKFPTWCRRLFVGLACGGLLIAGAGSAQAATTVTIIEKFNTRTLNTPSFTTAYRYFDGSGSSLLQPIFTDGSGVPANSTLWPETSMAIVQFSSEVHGLWIPATTGSVNADFPTDASGAGSTNMFLAVNGSVNTADIVYEKTVPSAVVAGHQNVFSLDLAELYTKAPAKVSLRVTYSGSGPDEVFDTFPFSLGAQTAWQTYTFTTTVPSGKTTAKITLLNAQSAVGGNDFGVDNIGFTDIGPDPSLPPNVECQAVVTTADCATGKAAVAASAFVNVAGSTFPAGSTYSVVPAGPYSPGTTPVTITATSPSGDQDTCSTTVTVVAAANCTPKPCDKDKDRDCKDKDRDCKDKDRDCKDKDRDCKDKDRDCKDKDRDCKDEDRDCKDKDRDCKDKDDDKKDCKR